MPFYGYWDPTYVLVVIGALLSMAASGYVNATFNRYSNVYSQRRMTGAEAARQILQSQGIYDVTIERTSGRLTDHYDPRSKVLRLSESVYGSDSVAAIGVAAHECGHAIQHAQGYLPLSLRGMMVPVVNFGAQLSWPLILIGFFLNGSVSELLLNAGILMFLLVVLFQLVTLPVELNASARAVSHLKQLNLLAGKELSGTRSVLRAAALTYVASAAAAVLQLLRLLILVGGKKRDD